MDLTTLAIAIITGIVSLASIAYAAYREGVVKTKNNQLVKDLHASDDAKQRKEEINSLDDDDFVARVRDSER